ncbi:MAG TPA: hypothetical protein VJK48_03320 [Chlamydiales bacterium]|nr:hypothetical protein [Chlamydiales bacterium]
MGTSPILADEDAVLPKVKQETVIQMTSHEELLGKTAVAEVRKAYEAGECDLFLQEEEERYQKALIAGEIDLLGSIRPGLSSDLKKWETQGKKLQQEKQKELLVFVKSSKEKNVFIEKVLSAATDPISSANEQDAIDLVTHLRQMAPGTGTTPEENLLIAIDLEYEYKALHLDLPDAPLIEKRTKQCVLKMDKLHAMQTAAEQFQDESLKEAIVAYAASFDARLAQSWDMADLNGLANGRKTPENASEEKVASILALHQDKFSKLTKQLIEEGK